MIAALLFGAPTAPSPAPKLALEVAADDPIDKKALERAIRAIDPMAPRLLASTGPSGSADGLLVVRVAPWSNRWLVAGRILWSDSQRRAVRSWLRVKRQTQRPAQNEDALRDAVCDVARSLLLQAEGSRAALTSQRIAVMPVQTDATVRDKVPPGIDLILLTIVQEVSLSYTVGPADIEALRRSPGACTDPKCLRDIGAALDTTHIGLLELARLAGAWIVTFKVIDSEKADIHGRVNQSVEGDLDALLAALPDTIRRALAGEK